MTEVSSDILDLLSAGESETLEFKATLNHPVPLARLIASFANVEGGTILVGVTEPTSVIGVDEDRFRQAYSAAIRLFDPHEVRSSLKFVDGGHGLKVAVVEVEKSSGLVLVQGSAFARSGATTRPMLSTQILERVSSDHPQTTLETLAQANATQTAHLEKLSADSEHLKIELSRANDPAIKRQERKYGFLIGIGASLIAALLWWVATKAIPALT